MTTTDLSNCDREAIHVPGGVQPHGVLLRARYRSLVITHASANAAALLGKPNEAILGASVLDWVTPTSRDTVGERLRGLSSHANQPVELQLAGAPPGCPSLAVAHRRGEHVVLEFETVPRPGRREHVVHAMGLAREALAQLRRASSLADLCNTAVRQVRELTGFDRVVLYRFDHDWHGEVLAEEVAPGVASFLGLHFPASDIPRQARELYCISPLRCIPQVDYAMVPLLAQPGAAAAETVDLSLSILRSVSPVHLEYLRNMGAKASMSVSIIKDDALWGLISCTHEHGTCFLTYETRTTCELVAECTASLIAAKEGLEDADYRAALQANQTRLLYQMSRGNSVMHGLAGSEASLLSVTGAAGAAVYIHGEYTLVGKTPSEAQISAIIHWLSHRSHEPVYATDALPQAYPEAEAYADTACGLLAVSLSKGQHNYVLWFRPEALQTVGWSGNPHKTTQQTEAGMRVHPRKSFELWQQTVRGHSVPWKRVEKEAAGELRTAIIDLVLQRSEEINKLNMELERSNVELDSFAYAASHDLREPLRGIHNYTNLAIKDLGDTHLVGDSGDRLHTVIKLTQRMEDLINSLLHYAKVGRMELSMRRVDIGGIVADTAEMLRPRLEATNTQLRVDPEMPSVYCDKVRAGEVIANLLTNALKYNDKAERWIHVGCHASGEGPPAFFVRDNGIGIREKSHEAIFRIFKRLHKRDQLGGGSGTGLTITRRIIERHGGKIWLESVPGIGTTFFFTFGDSRGMNA